MKPYLPLMTRGVCLLVLMACTACVQQAVFPDAPSGEPSDSVCIGAVSFGAYADGVWQLKDGKWHRVHLPPAWEYCWGKYKKTAPVPDSYAFALCGEAQAQTLFLKGLRDGRLVGMWRYREGVFKDAFELCYDKRSDPYLSRSPLNMGRWGRAPENPEWPCAVTTVTGPVAFQGDFFLLRNDYGCAFRLKDGFFSQCASPHPKEAFSFPCENSEMVTALEQYDMIKSIHLDEFSAMSSQKNLRWFVQELQGIIAQSGEPTNSLRVVASDDLDLDATLIPQFARRPTSLASVIDFVVKDRRTPPQLYVSYATPGQIRILSEEAYKNERFVTVTVTVPEYLCEHLKTTWQWADCFAAPGRQYDYFRNWPWPSPCFDFYLPTRKLHFLLDHQPSTRPEEKLEDIFRALRDVCEDFPNRFTLEAHADTFYLLDNASGNRYRYIQKQARFNSDKEPVE